MPEVLVIGGGERRDLWRPSPQQKNGGKVVLLERNEKVGRKIMITGKGRCNVTNDCADLNALISAVAGQRQISLQRVSRFMPSRYNEFLRVSARAAQD